MELANLFVTVVGVSLALFGIWAGRVFVLPQPPGSELSWPRRIRRALGAAVAGLGLFVIAGGLTTRFDHGDWITDFEQGRALARERGGPVIVDCWAEWCAACKEIFAKTLEHPAVKPRLDDFTKIKLDMDAPENDHLYERFSFSNLPWVAVFDSVEQMSTDEPRPRLVIREKISAPEFLALLDGETSLAASPEVGTWLAERGLLLTFVLVFLGGVALSFTPCVLPVYILTVNLMGAQRISSLSGRFGLSSVYVLGLAITYSVLGVVAGLTGTSMGVAFQDPRIVGAIAVIFLLPALFYLEILRLPQASGLATRVTSATDNRVLLALLSGMTVGFVAAPCIGPMLIGILTYIGAQRDVWLGFWLMFIFALGMGMLFLALGTSTAVLQRVRKTGAWGYRLEMLFAVVFIAVGAHFLRLVLPVLSGLVRWLAVSSPI